ncbi:hypothetical protein DFJ77DRAFT_30488 [Powellomyces hirtus]|nr:hypothetical protein DFJ77DRAFT_30488 [Powellomyces hirtus]
MAAIPAIGISAAIGQVSGFLGLVSTGWGLIDKLSVKPNMPHYYTVRVEAGDAEDASGNPLDIWLSDYTGWTTEGILEGSSKASEDKCGWDKGSADYKVYNGIANGEAPTMSIKTRNGFNLRYADIHAGANAVCVSNIILKGSDSQARRDEVFLPVGDWLTICGYPWNWGTLLNGVQQRCVWLDSKADTGNAGSPSILRLDMAYLSGVFNKGANARLKKTTFAQICPKATDLTKKGGVNQNFCKKRRSLDSRAPAKPKPIAKINVDSAAFKKMLKANPKFTGRPFVTKDNKIWLPKSRTFVDAKATKQGTRRPLSARDARLKAAEPSTEEDDSEVVDVQSCENDEATGKVNCTNVGQVTLPIDEDDE